MMRAVQDRLMKPHQVGAPKLNASNEVVDSETCTVTHPVLHKDERTVYAADL